MQAKKAALVVLAMVLTFASAAAGTSTASKQRVVITGSIRVEGWTLTPLTPGALGTDSGRSMDSCCWGHRSIVRDGQDVIVNDHDRRTFTGKRGTLVLSFDNEWTEAGNGYTIGASTWRVVSGTGAYKGVTGRGRASTVWLHAPSGPAGFQAEGFLTSR
jgi:hypothetical protein